MWRLKSFLWGLFTLLTLLYMSAPLLLAIGAIVLCIIGLPAAWMGALSVVWAVIVRYVFSEAWK